MGYVAWRRNGMHGLENAVSEASQEWDFCHSPNSASILMKLGKHKKISGAEVEAWGEGC